MRQRMPRGLHSRKTIEEQLQSVRRVLARLRMLLVRERPSLVPERPRITTHRVLAPQCRGLEHLRITTHGLERPGTFRVPVLRRTILRHVDKQHRDLELFIAAEAWTKRGTSCGSARRC